jgi:RHS repeat-associated protein
VVRHEANGAAVAYGYDADSLLTQAGPLTLSRLASSGQTTSTTVGNVVTSYAYNTYGEVESMETKVNGVSVFREGLQYDNAGRIRVVEEVLQGAPVQWNYGYDAIGRLVSDSKSNGVNNTYTFDGNGNRKTYNTIQPTFDNQDKLVSQGAITYTWDGLGNRIGKSDGTTYVHDGMGSLKTWSKGGNTISYEHDGLQRRVSRSRNGTVTARYVYDGQYRIVAETVSGSRFIYATQSHSPDVMLRNGNTYKVVKTHLGSVKMIVNADTGSVEQVMDYDAWGNVVADSNPGFQPFGFAGGIWDAESQLTHFGYRDYDASTGAWTSRDPVRLGGGLNVYAYSLDNPVGRIDPRGLWGLGALAAGGAEAGIGAAGVGANGSAGGVVFGPSSSGWSSTLFASGGWLAGGPTYGVGSEPLSLARLIFGAFAGGGAGFVCTTANNAEEFAGASETVNFNIGAGILQYSVQISQSNSATSVSVTLGPGLGVSLSTYATTTATTQ